MSRENVEIVRRIYAAAAGGDHATVLALYDPDVEWDVSRHPLAGLLGGGVGRGHEGVRNFYREWREAFEDPQDVLEQLIEVGDHVVSVSTMRGRGRASRIEVAATGYAGVWSFRNGRVTRIEWFGTREEALEAVGPRA